MTLISALSLPTFIFSSLFSPEDVEASSPAALAGLQPHCDYIVGADQVLQDVRHFYYHHHHFCMLCYKSENMLDFL